MKVGTRGKKTDVLRKVEKVMFDGTKITFYHLDKRSNWVCDSYWFAGMYNDFSFVSLVWEGLSVCLQYPIISHCLSLVAGVLSFDLFSSLIIRGVCRPCLLQCRTWPTFIQVDVSEPITIVKGKLGK